ncbi:MAG: hypothetical protein LZF62_380129 [Nitrospira sp.]|nr:MAG: hypothetical protein LZF62_380129 [Nitrospira sp.]
MSKQCTFCESKRHRIEFSTHIGVTYFCGQCGGIENHESKHENVYTAKYYSDNYFSIEAQQNARFTAILKSLEPFVKNYRVLDLGCGTGMFLKTAYDLGYRDSVGIDISVDAVEIARKRLVSTDVCVQLSCEPVVGRFGVIGFMDSIAHIGNLQEQFPSIISASLTIDGLVIVRTPRYSKTYFYYGLLVGWLLRLFGRSDIVSSQVFHLPARRFLFSEKALEALMTQHGLVKVYMSVEPEYSRHRQKRFGLKNRVAYLLLRGIPDFVRGGNRSIVFVARRK